MVAIFVVVTFLLFILIDILILKSQGKNHPAFVSMKVFDKSSFLLPAEIFLSTGHTWIKQIKDGLIRIGIDEFILKSLGKITLNVIQSEGKKVNKNDILFEANIGNRKIDFKAPISGEIKYVNKNIFNKNIDDPYNDDWILTFVPQNLESELKLMRTKESAKSWLKDEFNRLKDYLNYHSNQVELVGVTLADGGNIVEGVVSNLNDAALKDFESQFLSLK